MQFEAADRDADKQVRRGLAIAVVRNVRCALTLQHVLTGDGGAHRKAARARQLALQRHRAERELREQLVLIVNLNRIR